MDRDDIIRMAREVDFTWAMSSGDIRFLTRFAALIAAHERETQRDELLETLKLVFPTLERLKFEADGSYGNNFSQARADTARKNYQAARAAIKKAEGQA
jgi:hypothetical protein